MLPIKLLGISTAVGVLIAAPWVWANLPVAAVPVLAAHTGPSLPEPFLGAWVQAGTGADLIGRSLSNGYRWLPKGDLRSTSFTIAERWKERSLLPSYHATKDGGLFLSAVDLDADRQESFYLQPGAGGLSVWVTVAALDAGEQRNVRGPALGGQGESETREMERPLNQAAELSAVKLNEQGWKADPISDELQEQMRQNGALVRYWTKGDRTLQELLQRTETGSRVKLTHLPRQMETD
jgi:hypothetical protein